MLFCDFIRVLNTRFIIIWKQVDVSFTISEIDPYDAQTVMQQGSFRGINKTLERRIYKS